MELSPNQSALILTATDQGEITVDVASADMDGITASICTALAEKLMGDKQSREEIMGMVEK